MKKTAFYKQDWFTALVVCLFFGGLILSNNPLLGRLESFAYDVGVRMTSRTAGATDQVAIVAIDEQSIKEIGRWPWPRNVLADMIESLARAEVKAVGMLIFLTEPQADQGLGYIRTFKKYLEENPFPRNAEARVKEMREFLSEAEKELDTDGRLEGVLSAERNVYMPMYFELGKPLGAPDAAPPEFVSRNKLTAAAGGNAGEVEQTIALNAPLEQFGRHTAGIGHLNLGKNTSEGLRTESLVLEHYGTYYPSLSLLLAARSLNLGPDNIEVTPGSDVRLGRLQIRTDARMQMLTGFYPQVNGENAFPVYSFQDVRNGRVQPNAFRNKIVLIGSTAVGVGSLYSTPIGTLSSPELVANFIASILNQDFYVRPPWAMWVETGIVLAIALYLMLALPRLSATLAALISLGVLAVVLASGHYLLVGEKLWLHTVSPALLLLLGHVLVSTKRFLLTERLKEEAETDSAQTNRMLGLAFQGQGQLDMALDKFRKLPVDDTVLELFYNLALDFERKRQFSKAANCYDQILKHDPKYRDVTERRQRSVAAEQTVILGGKGASGGGGTMVLDTLGQKPTLGRYEIEKELGKGAMGTVYLGRDPRINRVVAIKTMALSQEFEANELAAVRERFFREAETAGRLSHPNIVTIFDAGEDQELAYIAMELLEGRDLTDFVKPGKVLPVNWVVRIVVTVADALDYAHKQGVVHRDIKPANIMYNPANHAIKVTDFGIARITASSRTKTGMVLGTPSYMSPEQIAGKHVDGRSDLFSLGVMLYEMLAGQQPFGGDSLATLMYQIATGEPADIASLRADLPPCIKPIVDRALSKNPDNRYQTGSELRDALLACVPDAPNAEAPAP